LPAGLWRFKYVAANLMAYEIFLENRKTTRPQTSSHCHRYITTTATTGATDTATTQHRSRHA